MKNNIIHVLDLIEYYNKNKQISAAMIFLDAEKAFDRVNWEFLLQLIGKLGFGEKFERVIKALYTKQTAQIIVNGELSGLIEIQRGTRQGCPLSPLLFVLTIEVLFNRIRDLKMIKGALQTDKYKLKAFADDVVLTVTDLEVSISLLMKIINDYGEVVGFKVNNDKTKALLLNVNKKQREKFMDMTGFEVVKMVKYLGIFMTQTNVQLYENNYEKMWNQIQQDLLRWEKLKLS